MDIRCGSCNKLFRIADEKVAGKAVRFKCSRCGEIITISKKEPDTPSATAVEPSAPAVPPQVSSPSSAAAPAVSPAEKTPPQAAKQEYQPQEYQPQEYQAPEPSGGMEDFDFSQPHEAAAAAVSEEESRGEGGFSFGAPGDETSSGLSGEGDVAVSENEARETEASFQFPADVISEPARKSAFASAPDTTEDQEEPGQEEPGQEERPSGEVNVPELGMAEDIASEASPDSPPVAVPLKDAGIDAAETEQSEDTIDLGQALAIPRTADREDAPSVARSAPRAAVAASSDRTEDNIGLGSDERVHPLASGNVSGAVSGLGCGLPVALLLLFGFGMMVKVVPMLSALPLYHLVIVIGTGIFGISVMIGMVISIAQAQAGRRLFFLLNILIGSLFGALYGTGMNVVTSLASGAGVTVPGLVGGAASGGTIAFLLSILIVIVRRIIYFSKEESFGIPLSVSQKVGIAASLLVVLGSLYAEGTLIGRMEQATQEIQQRLDPGINSDGLSVENPYGYIDASTGDLVVTGTVRNSLGQEKQGWYLEVGVYDKDQKLLATVRMLNGVQLLGRRDIETLVSRGQNADELRTRMEEALDGAVLPAHGSRDFEVRFLNPPAGMASFYPVLKKPTAGSLSEVLDN